MLRLCVNAGIAFLEQNVYVMEFTMHLWLSNIDNHHWNTIDFHSLGNGIIHSSISYFFKMPFK